MGNVKQENNLLLLLLTIIHFSFRWFMELNLICIHYGLNGIEN